MHIRNERPYGLEIAASGQLVEPGETAEVDAELGASLLEQPDNWSAVKPSKPAKADNTEEHPS